MINRLGKLVGIGSLFSGGLAEQQGCIAPSTYPHGDGARTGSLILGLTQNLHFNL